jgi:hypothetical protein
MKRRRTKDEDQTQKLSSFQEPPRAREEGRHLDKESAEADIASPDANDEWYAGGVVG